MRAFVVVGAILLAALGLRLAYVAVTPGYAIVHDARGYDEHAQSIARGEGFSERFTGKPTAFRPPGYAYCSVVRTGCSARRPSPTGSASRGFSARSSARSVSRSSASWPPASGDAAPP